jgi:hypothetical protein
MDERRDRKSRDAIFARKHATGMFTSFGSFSLHQRK